MPTSHHHQLSTIMDVIISVNPTSILDIGVGFGKYGVLCREYLELWDGRESYHHFTRRIDGIEVFSSYLTPIHEFVYNHVYIGDAQKIVPSLRKTYDLALLIDVLEHIPKQNARTFMCALLKKAKGVVVSTPKDIGHQEDAFGNVHETHVSQWSAQELRSLAPASLAFPDPVSHLMYLGGKREVARLSSKRRMQRLKTHVKRIPGAQSLRQFLTRT